MGGIGAAGDDPSFAAKAAGRAWTVSPRAYRVEFKPSAARAVGKLDGVELSRES